MGNELSSEAASQHQQEVPIGGAMYGAEQDAFFYPENGPESGHSSDYDNIQPMDEEELQRQLKLSTEKPDIYDTGVSEQLRKLLATLHEDDVGVSKAALSAKATEFVPGKPFSLPTSTDRVIQEFVPGKPFMLPVEREKSSAAFSDAGSESMSSVSRQQSALVTGLNTEAPEFVPSWQKASAPSAVAAAATTTGGDKKVWWYRDPQGVVRGPFSTIEMKAWSDKGYFSSGLEIALSDRGPYLPLSSVYPSPERPFGKAVEPREFATRMRQHILASRNVM